MACVCARVHVCVPFLGEILLSDVEMFSPHGLRWSSGSNGGRDSGQVHTRVNEDFVWLSLIKMFPRGWSIRGTNKKKKKKREM